MDRRLLLVGLSSSALLGLAGCNPPADNSSGGGGATGAPSSGGGGAGGGSGDSIKVGMYGDMTGDTATFGQSMKKGLDLALDEINASPPLGRKLEVVVEDDRGKSDEAVSAVTKLITQDKVQAIIGEVASSNSLAAAPKCQQEKIPMITPASTNPEVTRQGDYIFRICFIDPFQGSVMAKFAFSSLKARKAVILSDLGSDYSKGLSQFFKETFLQLGGQVVAEQSYQKGATDFNAQLNSLKGSNPDVIFVPGYYSEVGTIARQARDLGIKAPMLGGDGWDSPKLFDGAGTALEGCYFSNHYSAESKDERVMKFISAFKAKFAGEVPDAMAALSYDTALLLVDAIKRAGGVESEKLREAIATTKGFAGVTGSITLDEERNAKKPAVVLQIRGKEFKYVETVQP